MEHGALTMVNPQNGNLAFKIFAFADNSHFDHLQRHNYYSLIWVKEGSGIVKADFSENEFGSSSLFAFSPYQPFLFKAEKALSGIALQFHPDFYCIHMHQKEVACNGVLFNNIYDPPMTRISGSDIATLDMLLVQMRNEMTNPALAQYESLVSYLKLFLITASRAKTSQQPSAMAAVAGLKEPFLLQNLKEAIEHNFRSKHTPADYAEVLKVPLKALARVTKNHFNKTLTDLISERIIIEAKRELYLTNKPVKEIAYDLGYSDEYYFSRFFKTNADISPQLYRDTVGFGKAAG
ncbi:AraC family transcriptional regulator [Flavobacterium magnum]|uniref:AraC family transcriptional regulator n=1 Tax=Flavobacterium magnum TaxID=2162713 RepID=A0A2S0RHU3_9FLAO|nr:helix-turn-helix domain-containing protein [Flavobacterium magnum]AWA30840.1 AraC family transcriptional regulator [Flavobacterium magnum]